MKHPLDIPRTAGSWRATVRADSEFKPVSYIIAAESLPLEGGFVAEAWELPTWRATRTTAANARLMAAAPELYAALYELYDYTAGILPESLRTLARDALQKAAEE